MASTILVTGATGFIGRQLTRDLIDAGHDVRILARQTARARQMFGDRVEISEGDITDANAVQRACRGRELIYHIAGGYRFGLRHRRELWRSNVDGAENLLRGAATAGAGKVVHLSSGGLLKKKPGEAANRLVDERDFPEREPAWCPYKASKWHAEHRVFDWVKRGLPVVIASTTCPIGAGDEAPTPTGRMIRDFLQRNFPCYCHTGLNFVSVRDLSQGLQQVAVRGRVGERYLLSNANLWLKEFLDLLSAETGLPAPTLCLPDALIRLIGCGGELVEYLNPQGSGARVCLETAILSGRIQFFSNAKARSELDWEPVDTIQNSVREAVTWFRDEKETEVLAAPVRIESAVP